MARTRFGWILPVLLLAAGCGLGGGSGSNSQSNAFVFITVEKFDPSTVTSKVGDKDTSETTTVTLRSNLRSPGLTTPSPLDDVLITSYSVTFSGPGPVPNPFTRPVTIRVPAGTVSDGTVSGNASEAVAIVVVQFGDKRTAPLNTITQTFQATASITFRGTDGRGNKVEAEGSLVVIFAP